MYPYKNQTQNLLVYRMKLQPTEPPGLNNHSLFSQVIMMSISAGIMKLKQNLKAQEYQSKKKYILKHSIKAKEN